MNIYTEERKVSSNEILNNALLNDILITILEYSLFKAIYSKIGMENRHTVFELKQFIESKIIK